jgi:two-component system OmpR family response regulator
VAHIEAVPADQDIRVTIQVADLVVDEAAGVAHRGGVELRLSPAEFRLLAYLALNRGWTLSRTQLLRQVWGYDETRGHLLERHIKQLRRELEQHGPRLLHTAPGQGYVLRPKLVCGWL